MLFSFWSMEIPRSQDILADADMPDVSMITLEFAFAGFVERATEC